MVLLSRPKAVADPLSCGKATGKNCTRCSLQIVVLALPSA